MGWTKDKESRSYALLITFDSEEERKLFEEVIDKIQQYDGRLEK